MMTPRNSAQMSRNTEAGQAIILVAAALVVLLGFIGFAIDMGMLRYEKRLQQTAADAAAIAGADDLAHECLGTTPCANTTPAAQAASAANYFTDNGGGLVSNCGSSAAVGTVCVQVNNPPSYWAADPHSGDAKYVEVVVAAVHTTYFEKIVGINQETVIARAEATYNSGGGGSGSSCWWSLGVPAKEIGVDPYGNPTINANCGIYDNGNYDPKGKALQINTCSFQVSGTDTGNNSGGVDCNGQPQPPTYGFPTVADPLAGKISPPPVGTPQTFNPANAIPGTYSGINIGANQVVNFQPGIYVVTGSDFACGANATITGNGVMFYFTNGATINCQGGMSANLTAPSGLSGSLAMYNGVLMYQDPCDTNTGLKAGGTSSCSPANPNEGVGNCPPPGSGSNTGPELSGNDGSSFNGVLYFPADQLYLTGHSGTVSVDTLISDSSCIGGDATFDLVGSAGAGGGSGPLNSALSNAVLVE